MRRPRPQLGLQHGEAPFRQDLMVNLA